MNELLVSCSPLERDLALNNPTISANLASMLKALQLVREAYGQPIRVTSCFREPSHNSKVGGVPSSQHLSASAADITSADLPKLREAILSVQRLHSLFGQVIIYPSFIHLGLARAWSEPERQFKLTRALK